MSELYEMKLNETLEQDDFDVLRVPGGWVYTFYSYESHTLSSCFVPFNNEIKQLETKGE